MKYFFRFFPLILIAISIGACEEDAAPNALQFTSSQTSFTADTEALTITLTLERPADENTPITLEMQVQGLTHGNQFTVDPESVEVNGTLFLAFPKGEQETSFHIRKLGNPPLNGDETITFEIASVPAPLVAGQPSTLEIQFE